MYMPKLYQIDDQKTIIDLMVRHNFATLVTVDQGVPFATSLPFMVAAERGAHGFLLAHMARANPQWRHFVDQQEVLVIFQGPHAYISPSWYTSDFAVPTWNYITIHAYGYPRLIDDETLVQKMVSDLVANQELPRPQPWQVPWSERHLQLLKGIVAFELELTRLEGKAKLSQNRSTADRQGVVEALAAANDSAEREVADLMAANLMAKDPSVTH